MERKSELAVEKIVLISRRIFWSFMALFFLAGLVSAFTESYDLKWLEAIVPFIGGISLLLLVASWIMPGILILLGVPWLAHAWLRGINPIGISSTPWEEMSVGGKFLIYLYSTILFVAIILAIMSFILTLVSAKSR
jgi:hypothetical protein